GVVIQVFQLRQLILVLHDVDAAIGLQGVDLVQSRTGRRTYRQHVVVRDVNALQGGIDRVAQAGRIRFAIRVLLQRGGKFVQSREQIQFVAADGAVARLNRHRGPSSGRTVKRHLGGSGSGTVRHFQYGLTVHRSGRYRQGRVRVHQRIVRTVEGDR